MEPNPSFVLLVGNKEGEVEFDAPGAPGFTGGFHANVRFGSGAVHNAIAMRPLNATLTPAYPVRLRIRKAGEAKVELKGVLHQVSESGWKAVPLVQ